MSEFIILIPTFIICIILAYILYRNDYLVKEYRKEIKRDK